MKFSVPSRTRGPGTRARIHPQAGVDGRYVPEFRPVLRTIVSVARFLGRWLNETVRNAFQRNYAVRRNPFSKSGCTYTDTLNKQQPTRSPDNAVPTVLGNFGKRRLNILWRLDLDRPLYGVAAVVLLVFVWTYFY